MHCKIHNLAEIIVEVRKKALDCSDRGLLYSSRWLSEILISTHSETKNNSKRSDFANSDEEDYNDVFLSAKCYFDLKEYDRCSHITKPFVSKSKRLTFLHFYSRYLSGQRQILHNSIESLPNRVVKNTESNRLKRELAILYNQKQLDGYCLYLYGVLLKRLSLDGQAQSVLCEALQKEPCIFDAWAELSSYVSQASDLNGSKFNLPSSHWMYHFFLAHTYLELQMSEEAIQIYVDLQNEFFPKSSYILAQLAICYHNVREVDQAVSYFQQMIKADPYRLDDLDTYSNLLYVKDQRVELAHLAHKMAEVDKYRVQTCCVIGNFYSLRSEHEKAVSYFQRALKLNPSYLSAWTLMGHEFMELKNTNASIYCYRQAIDVNKRDYRAWYGLGQTYESLKMPFYCLYYFKKALQLRPNDSRMLVAVGQSYENLDKVSYAIQMYWKAHCAGDMEGGISLLQLARLYEKSGNFDDAASAYEQLLILNESPPTETGLEEEPKNGMDDPNESTNMDESKQDGEDSLIQTMTTALSVPGGGGCIDQERVSKAHLFLAKHYLKKCEILDRERKRPEAIKYVQAAFNHGNKCYTYVESREESKIILKQVEMVRNKMDLVSSDKIEICFDHEKPLSPQHHPSIVRVTVRDEDDCDEMMLDDSNA